MGRIAPGSVSCNGTAGHRTSIKYCPALKWPFRRALRTRYFGTSYSGRPTARVRLTHRRFLLSCETFLCTALSVPARRGLGWRSLSLGGGGVSPAATRIWALAHSSAKTIFLYLHRAAASGRILGRRLRRVMCRFPASLPSADNSLWICQVAGFALWTGHNERLGALVQSSSDHTNNVKTLFSLWRLWLRTWSPATRSSFRPGQPGPSDSRELCVSRPFEPIPNRTRS